MNILQVSLATEMQTHEILCQEAGVNIKTAGAKNMHRGICLHLRIR